MRIIFIVNFGHLMTGASKSSVLQMDMLEMDTRSSAGSQGVVLMLLAPDADTAYREGETTRSLRMYNLTSLISLAKWAVNQQVGSACGSPGISTQLYSSRLQRPST